MAVAAFRVADDRSQATIRFAGRLLGSHCDAKGTLEIRGDTLTVPLDFSHREMQTLSVNVRDKATSGTLTIEYYPRETYEKIGSSLPGVILLVSTIPRAETVSLG